MRPAIVLSTPPTTLTPTTTQANSLYECSNTNQLINFYYACFNYPTVSSLTKAINHGYMKGWQGLTSQQVKRHIVVSPEFEMGHMDQTRQGVQSTQDPAGHADSSIQNGDASAPKGKGQVTLKNPPPVLIRIHHNGHMEDAPQEPHNARTHFVFCQVHTISRIISSNQTGRFPVTSNRGHAYVVIFYIFDANYICSAPIKNRYKEELLRAYRETYDWLVLRGFKPQLHKLDNETSQVVEAFVRSQHTHLQYTPPDMHRTNPAERAIL